MGKHYILEPAEEVRVHTDQRVDENGTSVVRRAMIQASLS